MSENSRLAPHKYCLVAKSIEKRRFNKFCQLIAPSFHLA